MKPQQSNLSKEANVVETLFKIQNKEGTTVDFILNPSQRAYDLQSTNRDIIAKARQKGFSAYKIATNTARCMGVHGTRAVLISHEGKATQRLLDRARFYIKHIKGPQPEMGRASRNEFYFPKTESSFYIGTAGAKAFGRGDTITDLHISEYAWWESDAIAHVAGLFQAVPKTGRICIESTGNGMANDYYYMCMNAEKLGFNLFFRAWWEDDEYSMTPNHPWEPEGMEHYFQDMKTGFDLTESQLYWYWLKLLEFRMDLNTMQQEYPSTLEECFRATGGALFPNVSRVKSEYWRWGKKYDQRLDYLDGHPDNNRYTYVIGADPSGGTGNDNAAAQIVCLETLEQITEYKFNRIDPVQFGHFLCSLGSEYGDAFIICEANHHGIATHSVLLKNYRRTRIYKRHIAVRSGKNSYGYMTTEASKPALVGAIKECIDMGLVIYGADTVKELVAFEEDDKGKMGGASDDLVIALGLACFGAIHYARHKKEPLTEKVEFLNKENTNYMYYTFDDCFTPRQKENALLRRHLN